CNTACGGLCQACVASKTGGTDGTCANIKSGTDPDNECGASAASTCGTNGSCNGSGACALWASGTVCKASSCSAGVEQNADTCNGSGTCVSNGTQKCSPYVCGATACKTSCSSDSDCVSGDYCGSGSCLSKKGQI